MGTWMVRGAILVVLTVLGVGWMYGDEISAWRLGRSPVVIQNVDATPAPGAKRVLFIGNSHTYVSKVPRQVAHILKNTPGADPIWFRTVLYPGVGLGWHTSYGGAIEALSQPWDVVILQGRSLEPLEGGGVYEMGARRLMQAAREGGSKDVVLWETWPRRRDDPVYQSPEWFGATPAEQAKRLRGQIARVGAKRVAPIGSIWAKVMKDPGLSPGALYRDSNHASVLGSHLAACVVSRQISGVACEKTTWVLPGVDAGEVEIVRRASSLKVK